MLAILLLRCLNLLSSSVPPLLNYPVVSSRGTCGPPTADGLLKMKSTHHTLVVNSPTQAGQTDCDRNHSTRIYFSIRIIAGSTTMRASHTPCLGILSRRRAAIWRDGLSGEMGSEIGVGICFVERTRSAPETAERRACVVRERCTHTSGSRMRANNTNAA